MIKETNNKRFYEVVDRVVVDEYTNGDVWLAIWCKNPFDTLKGKDRYNVFFIKTKVNESWVCEGDLGSGIKF